MTPLQRLARRLGYDLTPRRKAKAPPAQLVALLAHFRITCVLDVGANIGQYGALLREWGYPGRIVSFEPQVGAHRKLEQRAAADPDWQVAPRMALGERDGQVELEISAESDMSSILPQGALLRQVSPSSAVVRKETVPLCRIDDVAGAYFGHDDRLFLKIDAQGYEAAVLAGAAGLLERCVGLQLEMALVPLYEGERPFRAMLDELAAHGFEPYLFLPGYFERKLARQLQLDGVFIRPGAAEGPLGDVSDFRALSSSGLRQGDAWPCLAWRTASPQGRGRFPYCRQPRRERKVLTCPAGGFMVLRWLPAAIMLAAALSARAANAEIRIGVAGPMTGANAWFGEQYQRGTELAVEDLNANGGVLGQSVELIVGDDFCDPDQAVALARKLVSDGVVFVAGHWCSHSAIPASKIYEQSEILMIAPGAISSKLTDEGGPNVFRVCGRDDRQGAKVADYLADHWNGKKIAILDDGTTFGTGLAEGARRRLHERGVRVALDEAYTPGEAEYSTLASKMEAAGVDVFFVGGYHRETGLIFRQARDRDYGLQLIANSAMATADFPMIAGPGLEGTVMMAAADARENPEAAEIVARFRAQGYDPPGFTLYAYAAVQVWAQAVAATGSVDLDALTAALHSRQFDTVLGRIGFDERGDVTGFEPWQWFVWQSDGTYVPLEPSP